MSLSKIIVKILDLIFGYNEDDSLITKEGYEILADPIKRVKLRKMIDNYHKTGFWDFSIME